MKNILVIMSDQRKLMTGNQAKMLREKKPKKNFGTQNVMLSYKSRIGGYKSINTKFSLN